MTTPTTNVGIVPEKFRFLMKTLDNLKNGIRILGINPVYKQSLMRDINIIESIMKTGKVGDKEALAKNG